VKRLRTPRLSMLWRVMLYTLSSPTPTTKRNKLKFKNTR
jgi:hypothetical protein